MGSCGIVVARERIGGEDEPWQTVKCLLPAGHEGPHADWTAWLGVKNPDFSAPGKSAVDTSNGCENHGRLTTEDVARKAVALASNPTNGELRKLVSHTLAEIDRVWENRKGKP